MLGWLRRTFSCGALDALMPLLTHLGDGGGIWLLAAAALLAMKKYRRSGVMLLCALACGVLIGNVALKNLTARSLPCWLEPSVRLLIAAPKDYSFPSGHTFASTIGASCLMRTDRRFGAAAVPLAALIAFSRLYLFVHFPSDVLASVALGPAITAGVSRLFRRIPERSAL